MYYLQEALMYRVRKRLLSQNFLIDGQLVKQLIRRSSIDKQDLVLEIGPGQGIITQELLDNSGQVLAIELDPDLYSRLLLRLGHQNRLKLIRADFLRVPLPNKPYKVFSNIPFRITGEVIRKLLESSYPPKDGYLVVQNEAADKFLVNSFGNTLATILYFPWWDIKIVHRFDRADFSPQPHVDSVLLHIKPRSIPLVSGSQGLYRDFVSRVYQTNRSAKFIPPDTWIHQFQNLSFQEVKTIQGSFAKLKREQQGLQKIHRTRTDKNWRKFRV